MHIAPPVIAAAEKIQIRRRNHHPAVNLNVRGWRECDENAVLPMDGVKRVAWDVTGNGVPVNDNLVDQITWGRNESECLTGPVGDVHRTGRRDGAVVP
jgi:hypothetical protein